jgi:tetratricopeptide (TPR) repeat protein/anti-sigma regulatory factor (Ser/Thr protein kinase)
MRRIFLIVSLGLLIFSIKAQQDAALDSVLAKGENYPEIADRVDFLVQAASHEDNQAFSIELLEEARIYAMAYGLPINDSLYNVLGEHYTRQFMFTQAVNIYDTLSVFYAKKQDTANQIISIDQMARNYVRAGQSDSALSAYMYALTLLKDYPDDYLKFRINFHLAHFYLVASGTLSMADKYLDECQKILADLHDDSLRLEYYQERGLIHVYNEQFDSARYFFNRSGQLIDSMGNYEKIDQYYNSMAVFSQLQGKRDEALRYYKLAYEMNLKNENYIGLYVNSYNLYTFYNEMGDFEHAEKYILLSLEYAEKNRIGQYRVASYQQLHQFYAENEDFEKAYEYMRLMNESVESMHLRELNSRVADLTIQYDVLKTRDDLKLLTQENEIQSLKLRNDKMIIVGLIILVIGIAIYFVLLTRQNRIKTKQKTDQLILKNLMQQMNPHFIFNTLNSIQYYIYNHSELDTNDYISKFASLIRRILDNSHKNSITIAEEIETVQLYIQLEQIRFNHSFDYEVITQPNLSIDDLRIPSMFIQPFIENAIVHGLRHKKDRGNLLISFQAQNDILECIIEDNGVGRKNSASINAQKKPKHESKALSIAHERLKLLSNIHNKKLSIKYADIEEGQDAKGTRVIIQLPFVKQ